VFHRGIAGAGTERLGGTRFVTGAVAAFTTPTITIGRRFGEWEMLVALNRAEMLRAKQLP
jgi:hypothetical protein